LPTIRYRFNMPWRYDAEMGTANTLQLRRDTASIMKGFGIND